MATVKYKKPTEGMQRMVVKPETTDRPSLGMTEVKGEIYYLSPDIIIPYKNQARQNIADESLLELADSIQSQGIIQPLQIISSLDNEGKFEVISGERRLRAAKKIGLEKIPCMILDRNVDANEIALIENIQRENLHPIELANAIANLLQGNKYGSQTTLGKRIGIAKSRMSHLLAISRLPEDVKEHLLKKKEIKINFLKNIAYLKDKAVVREKVFRMSCAKEKYKSILRLSFDGKSFRFDQLKTDHLSPSEKKMLKEELSKLVEWLVV